ncbi:hypothetical protein AALC17_01540 [Oscillospiraceae bacterium 38-13]
MNIITAEPREVCGIWLVEVQSQGGQKLLINHNGTKEEAVEKALLAEPEPA